MKNSKLLIIVAVILVLGVGGFLVLRGGESGVPSISPGISGESKSPPAQVSKSFVKGERAPEVTFTDFDGNTHSLSDFAGQAVVLDYWAAWCPFCIAEMPELQAAQDKYGDELVMIGVHRSDTENKNTGLKFANEVGVSYLLVTDADGALYRAAGGFGMPVAVFIDKGGVVQEVKSGPKTTEEIEEKVGALLQD